MLRGPILRKETSCLPPFSCSELNRFDNLRVGRAATQVSRQVVLDRVVVRIRLLVEQLARHQDESRRAEAALERAGLDERLLHGIELGCAFDGFHAGVLGKGSEVEATRNRAAVHEDGAAAAHSRSEEHTSELQSQSNL